MAVCVKPIGLEEWLENASFFNDYNYTHFWEYANKAAERVGAVSEHIAVFRDDGALIALSDARIKSLPLGLGGIAYISGGPMVDQGDGSFELNMPAVLNALKSKYVNERGCLLRISQRHKITSQRKIENEIYHQSGFVIHGKTNATMLIDLSVGVEAIRKGFHQKWRNVLNKGERQDIEVVAGDSTTLFVAFSRLFSELVSEKSFDVALNDRFYSQVQKLSPPQERFHMAIAYHNGDPVAGHLSSMCGDTSVYLLGATNDAGRKLGAAYLLQWHAIEESISRGCHWYDLGGIDELENPHVYHFKQRMGGVETEVGNVFQFGAGMRGAITLAAEKTYKLITRK